VRGATGHDDLCRIVGGTLSLVNALVKRLHMHPSADSLIRLNQAVTSIQYLEDEDKLFVSCTRAIHADIDGNPKENSNSASSCCDEIVHYKASHVSVTLPPQLAATAIEYTPPLDSITSQSMLKTKTWMAHAMKVALIYSKPFWRTNGLSGMAMTYDTSDKNPVQQ
jgi:monoamine oxidase